jgi:phage repressor protein C with HTH and peptisase S24 domain
MNSDTPQVKPKKVMTSEMLRNLELAREKARIKRKEQGELSQLRKEFASRMKAEEIHDLKQKLGKEEPESTEEESPEPVQKNKKTTKKPIVIVEESESDSEDEQVVYIKRKSNKPRTILQEEPFFPEGAPAPVAHASPYQGMHPSMLSRRRF